MKAMMRENKKRLILIQSLIQYDEQVGEEEDQIVNFSPIFYESDGEEEEEQFSFDTVFKEIEQEDECQIFDEGDEEQDEVFEFLMIIIEENFPLKIDLDSNTSNTKKSSLSIDFSEFDKSFSSKMDHSKFIMIVLNSFHLKLLQI